MKMKREWDEKWTPSYTCYSACYDVQQLDLSAVFLACQASYRTSCIKWGISWVNGKRDPRVSVCERKTQCVRWKDLK
jgi:hypothetical protein